MKVPLTTYAGLVVGLMIGVSAGGVYATGLRFRHVEAEAEKSIAKEREAWKLRTIVVMAEDVTAGETLISYRFASREVPTQFVTASNVLPDQFNLVVNKPLSVSLRKGDPLLWQYVPTAGFDAGSIALYPGE